MKTSQWHGWITDWLKRHPVKGPPAELQRELTQGVMAKIRAQSAPAPATISRPAFALAGIAVALLLTAIWFGRPVRPSSQQLAQEAQQDWQILFVLGEMALLDSDEEIQEALQAEDEILLAEAVRSSGPAAQADEVLRLIEELEALEAVTSDEMPGSEEEWLEELKRLDEEELLALS